MQFISHDMVIAIFTCKYEKPCYLLRGIIDEVQISLLLAHNCEGKITCD